MNIKFVLQTSHFGSWVILLIGCQSERKQIVCKTGKSPLFDYIPGGTTKVIPGNFVHKKKMMNIYQEKKKFFSISMLPNPEFADLIKFSKAPFW